MKKEKKYCCYCGSEITKKDIDQKLRDYCENCNTVFYENPLPVASSIVVNENREVLLVKRMKEPYKDMWCLPIGFAESGEEVSHAALRELEEEAGIKGEIIRLIDVDTVDNYFYGSLAIVAYEVKMIGGNLAPGDDASDAKYFPIRDIPQLAWASNEKALEIYINVYKDTWSMIDSFKSLFPEIVLNKNAAPVENQQTFLSNLLTRIIDNYIEDISERWLSSVKKFIPGLDSSLEIVIRLNKNALRGIQFWLKRDEDTLGVEEFIETGTSLKEAGIPLPDVLNAMALSRKSLWTYMARERKLFTPLEIYTTLEMNNRIIFFYDKMNYFLTVGYFK